MTGSRKHVVFDIVGTCVSYDALFNAIDHRLGDKLLAQNVKPRLFGYLWIEVTEREYTYLSMNGRYVGFREVFSSLFYRMLHMSGIEDPHAFASDEDLKYILEQYMKLQARPGIAECFQMLRENGFTVWALTAGDVERVGGYFRHNNIHMPKENFISCDSFKIGKPDPKVYQMMLEKLGKDDEKWFAAAHNWDSAAAKLSGFKAAYCTIWEKVRCDELFGPCDVTADTFPEMARAIVSAMPSSPAGRRPVPNPVASFWNAEPLSLDHHRTTPDLPTTADVVIIGSGFSGVATAYHLLKDNPKPPSTIILEARNIASGATGRNGGHVKPDTYFNVTRYAGLYGEAAAAELQRFETQNVYAVKELVESERLDCDFHLTRAVDVYLDATQAEETAAAYQKLKDAGVVDLSDTAYMPASDAERLSGVKGAHCAFSFTAAHLWPAKMVQQLLIKVLPLGLNVQANTPVEFVSPSLDSAKKWTIQTPRGVIKTSHVVYATNGYTSSILPSYAQAITPIRGIASHIESPKGRNAPHLVNTYALRFGGANYDYLIPRADGSIIVGGARQRFWHNPQRWFDSVQDDGLVDEAVSYFDGYMQRHFRGWEDSNAQTSRVWTGVMGYSADFMPHVGHVPNKPGQHIIAGFNGHGMPQILLSAKGLAAMIRDGVAFGETGIPSLFESTEERVRRIDSPLEDSFRVLWGKSSKL
ncbi:DAO-domain-containing protein [Polyplosphaeria fusca]|uniref:DAO-domain-containing protein n=1 Tax=Polyplosphaeria fusca TaxID=682080 RepID=A0A9P4V0C8_9PLEO|nr:DAO-domain-containing protein [Polyplosphaeria fusca]